MKFCEKYKINVHDEDLNGVVSPTGCLRYMQDSANCHMEADGPSYYELFSAGKAFIISRIKVVFHGELHSHEHIDGYTWACEGKGVSFPRCYEVVRDGELIIEARSVWALCDTNTKRLCRAGDPVIRYSTDKELDIELPRIIKPTSEFEKVGEKEVTYTDVDLNRHMNNTVYADMFWNYVPAHDGLLPRTLDIFYKSEAKLGEKLEIYRASCEDGWLFRSVRSDGKVNAEVEYTTKKAEK